VAPLLVASALATSTPAWAGLLVWTAAYRERIALPPDAVFEAVLQDVSKADAPATVLGRAAIDPAGAPSCESAVAQAGRPARAVCRESGSSPDRQPGDLPCSGGPQPAFPCFSSRFQSGGAVQGWRGRCTALGRAHRGPR
jgi:hypothetical protein